MVGFDPSRATVFPRRTLSRRSPRAQKPHAAEIVSPPATPMNLNFSSLALPPLARRACMSGRCQEGRNCQVGSINVVEKHVQWTADRVSAADLHRVINASPDILRQLVPTILGTFGAVHLGWDQTIRVVRVEGDDVRNAVRSDLYLAVVVGVEVVPDRLAIADTLTRALFRGAGRAQRTRRTDSAHSVASSPHVVLTLLESVLTVGNGRPGALRLSESRKLSLGRLGLASAAAGESPRSQEAQAGQTRRTIGKYARPRADVIGRLLSGRGSCVLVGAGTGSGHKSSEFTRSPAACSLAGRRGRGLRLRRVAGCVVDGGAV